MKPLPEAPKPSPSGGNGTGPTGTTGTAPTGTTPTGTAPTGTAPASVIAGGIIDNGTGRTEIGTDLYELNKLNAGKPGFTEDGEMIMLNLSVLQAPDRDWVYSQRSPPVF